MPLRAGIFSLPSAIFEAALLSPAAHSFGEAIEQLAFNCLACTLHGLLENMFP
jgi:hypothetical protein